MIGWDGPILPISSRAAKKKGASLLVFALATMVPTEIERHSMATGKARGIERVSLFCQQA